jgi:hypothetical protein
VIEGLTRHHAGARIPSIVFTQRRRRMAR